MPFRARLLTTCLIAGCGALVACAEGSSPDDTLAPGAGKAAGTDAEGHPTRAVCPQCTSQEPTQLGGETSEFDGVDGRQPDTDSDPVRPAGTRRERDLADLALAHWLHTVEGPHELPLRWRESFVDAGISGHAEQTSVSFDVTALRAFDVQFTGSGEHELQLEVAVQLLSADGALEASFENTLRLRVADDGSDQARSVNSPIVPLEQARGSLDLNLDPDREVQGGLSLALAFAGDSVRGQLSASVQYPGEPARRLITGSFPDDGCGLDESPIELGATPDGFAQSASSSLQVVAGWLRDAPRSANARATLQGLRLELGTAQQACQSGSLLIVYAPLRLRGGGIDLRQDARVELTRDAAGGVGGAGLWTRRQYLPSDRLRALTGIVPSAEAAGASYIAPRVHLGLSNPDNLFGQLWLEPFDSGESTVPLSW